MNHTPTPWRYERTREWGDCVRGGTRINIGDGKQDEGYVAFRLKPNDAKYIVQACNSHDALVAAIRAALEFLQRTHASHVVVNENVCTGCNRAQQLRDALAAAGEKAEPEPHEWIQDKAADALA